MTLFLQYDEICKYFAEGKRKDASTNELQKHLRLHDLGVGDYLTAKFALWIDFRMIDENTLHGTGKEIGREGGGITAQVNKKAESAGELNTYVYTIMDAQLNIMNGAFASAIYKENVTHTGTSYGAVCSSNRSWKEHI